MGNTIIKIVVNNNVDLNENNSMITNQFKYLIYNKYDEEKAIMPDNSINILINY